MQLAVLGTTLGAQATEVVLELGALEDVTVGAAALARAAGDGGVETAGAELLLDERVDLGVLLALGERARHVARLLTSSVSAAPAAAARFLLVTGLP